MLWLLVLVLVMFVVLAFHDTRAAKPVLKHRDLVIVSSHWKEDLCWLKNAAYPVVVCDKPGAPSHCLGPSSCVVPQNRGREITAYLQFILDHWDDLPNRVAFIHGHENAPHQKRPLLDAIARANPRLDFVSLNDDWHELCLDERCEKTDCDFYQDNPGHKLLRKYWKSHFEPYLGIEFPSHLKSERGAQFVVTRRAIRRFPREAYERWLDLFMSTTESDYFLGIAFECVWHIMFGRLSPVMSKDDTRDWFVR